MPGVGRRLSGWGLAPFSERLQRGQRERETAYQNTEGYGRREYGHHSRRPKFGADVLNMHSVLVRACCTMLSVGICGSWLFVVVLLVKETCPSAVFVLWIGGSPVVETVPPSLVSSQTHEWEARPWNGFVHTARPFETPRRERVRSLIRVFPSQIRLGDAQGSE